MVGEENQRELVEEYLGRSWLEGFATPVYGGYSVVELASSVYSAFGAQVPAPECRILGSSDVSQASRVAFIVVDALGYFQLLEYSDKVLNNILNMGVRLEPLTTVAPSTTAVAIASMATGTYPGQHGVLGYVTWVKEAGTVVKTLGMKPAVGGHRDQLRDSAWKPETIFSIDTPFAKLWAEGIQVKAYVPRSVSDTEYTRMVYSGADIEEYVTLGELSVKLARELKGEGTTLLLAYIPNLDEVLHVDSPASEEYRAELWHVLKALERVFEAAVGNSDSAVIVTSDHGGIDVSEDNVIWLNKLERLAEKLYVSPSGESRMAYLHTSDKSAVSAVLEEIGVAAVDSSEAVSKGLFGPTMRYRDRVGDVIALPRGSKCLRYPYGTGDEEFRLRGHHGGLTSQEVIVPLLYYVGRR